MVFFPKICIFVVRVRVIGIKSVIFNGLSRAAFIITLSKRTLSFKKLIPAAILVSQGCHNKIPKTEWLQQ